MTHEDDIAKVRDLVKHNRMAMLTTVDGDGALVSRPMAVQEIEFDGDLWFFADGAGAAVDQVRRNPQANVSFSSGSSWLSIAGQVAVVDDDAKIRELWNPVVEAWFPDGPETPGLVLLRVDADTAEYWDTPGGRIASVISFVKAKVTGERYDGGENEVVDLP
jgi:general stress protein 26